MDSSDGFDEASLSDKKSFYSELNLEDITDKDYVHAQKVFKELKLKDLGNYHDLYVQGGTLLIADVFGKFRSKCIEIYELDPAHFLSAPGLACQACFKKIKAELELLTNIDILLMTEKGIRGGICHVTHRHAKANNKYMKNYDKNIKSSYLTYLNANNLYGWAMLQKRPVSGFERVKELSKFDERFIKKYDEDRHKRQFLEVDFEYPKYLFNLHSDLPFLIVKSNILKCNKVVCDIYDKKNYVVHIGTLKQALNHGLILKKAHRIIQFNQKAQWKPYIDINTKLRVEAKNEFEKDFFKLMNNSVFGKTMKNVRKQIDIKLVTTDKRKSQLASEPNYHTTKYISEYLIAIEMKKTKQK